MPRVVMCPPDHFSVEYIINPWMDPGAVIDRTRATSQYTALKETYAALGATVLEIPPQEDLPDMTFAANHGTVVGNVFIPANFTYAERQSESIHAREFFADLGFTVREINPKLRFEGQGDLLLAGDTYFLGFGPRTDREVEDALAPLLGRPIITLELVDPLFYHLDTCFAPLGNQAVMITPRAFTSEGLQRIHKQFRTVIEVQDEDNALLPCNLVRISQHVVMNKGASAHVRQSLEGLGLTVHHVDTSEFLKSGGSVKCLTLLVDEVPPPQ